MTLSRLILLAALFAGIAGGNGPAGAATDGRPAISLRLPLDCNPGKTCEVIKYVDNDPGPGIRDYNCGDRSGGENNYASTSIAIRDRKVMAAGVDVFAAAPGLVEVIRDEMADTGVYGPETREELDKRGCGNAVRLAHDDGWSTLYCHLKRGSVRVRPGDRVQAGQTIAQVGMSGLTEVPHLFFSVRQSGKPVDPFIGQARAAGCGLGERPLWEPDALKALAASYKPVLLRAAGFAATPMTVREAREGNLPETLPANTGTLHFWTEIIGLHTGDMVNIQITAPDGKVLANGTSTLERGFAMNFMQGHADRHGPAWPAGTYRGITTVKRNGQSFAISGQIMIR